MVGLLRIRTLVSGCKLQLRLLINVLAESGAERVPLFWERLPSCVRHASLETCRIERTAEFYL
jgi:4-hydroxyphenylpyruvate dioxygenase-like putative hemolysin